MNLNEFVNALSYGKLDTKLKQLYGSSDNAILRSRARCLNAAERFSRLYPICSDIRVFSAPGHIDLSGSICGERSGCVLAAASDRDVLAIASLNGEGVIRVTMDNSPEIAFKVSDLRSRDDEQGTPAALIRAAVSKAEKAGIALRGFDMFVTSDIPESGAQTAGLSVLFALAIEGLCAENTPDTKQLVARARAAESAFSGSASGIAAYTLCAEGGIVFADGTAPGEPEIRRFDADISASGYCVCETAAGGEGTASCSADLCKIAAKLGAETLAEVNAEEFYSRLSELRESFGDRALARAAGFFEELDRLRRAADSLEIADTEGFFGNIDCGGSACEESLGVKVSRRILSGNGAVTVGSSSGTLAAFVPNYLAQEYISGMEGVFGVGSCRSGAVRTFGACEIVL